MNYSVDNAFADFDRQRDELQRYVTGERQALVEQLRQTAGEVVRTTLGRGAGAGGQGAAVRGVGARGADRGTLCAGVLAGRREGEGQSEEKGVGGGPDRAAGV